ncbi:2-dehydropantoate 2-reductase [Neptunomonas sp. XY-337]|uniref:ketopantoate reductase family protein n=1 Tax=Neptunomonas sp. XY-337 TaxID=2561897 RepID=UPI00145B303C|nr:2-dehydropantoate 2-reductase [Neptunomonas sp. XY-337]
MNWHILGGGAIGLLWAFKLSQAGHQVTVIVRDNSAREQLRVNGLHIISAKTKKMLTQLRYVAPSQTEAISHLLVATKSYQSVAAIQQIQPCLEEGAHVVLLQNGMGQHEEVAQLCKQQTVYAALTTDGAFKETPVRVVWAGVGETFIGRLSGASGERLFEDIPDVAIVDNILQQLWCKVAINAAINPLTALHDCRNGDLIRCAELRQKMEAVCEEVEKIAAALAQPLFREGLFTRACAVAQATAQNYSSMHQDIHHKRQTEIEYMTGFLCRKADDLGLEVPVNQYLYQQIKCLESASDVGQGVQLTRGGR